MDLAIFYKSLTFAEYRKNSGRICPPPILNIFSCSFLNLEMIFKLSPFVGDEIADS